MNVLIGEGIVCCQIEVSVFFGVKNVDLVMVVVGVGKQQVLIVVVEWEVV